MTSLVECALPSSVIWNVKPAELQRQRTVEADVGMHQLGALVSRELCRSGAAPLEKFGALLLIEVAHLLAGADDQRLVLAEVPGAGGMVAGRMRDHDIATFLSVVLRIAAMVWPAVRMSASKTSTPSLVTTKVALLDPNGCCIV